MNFIISLKIGENFIKNLRKNHQKILKKIIKNVNKKKLLSQHYREIENIFWFSLEINVFPHINEYKFLKH